MIEIHQSETIEQRSWMRRNLPTAVIVSVLVCHSFISEWISFPVYISAVILICANFLFFVYNRTVIGWLKANLYALAILAGLFTFTFLISRLMTFLGALVPDSVASTFPAILVIGVVLYLIGVGFYLVEKTTKI